MKKLDFEKEYSQKIQPLFNWGRKPLMNIYNRPDYEKFGFTKEDIPELLRLAIDIRYEDFYDYEEYEKEIDRFFYATIYAVEILGRLQAIEAIKPILEKLYENEDNDFLIESMPNFFGDMGVNAIEILKEHIRSRDEVQLILFEVFKHILEKHPEEEDLISSFLIDYLNTTKSDSLHITFGLLALVDCSGAKHIEFIREIFKTKDIDYSIFGDIESIEIRLGLREKRDTPLAGFWSFDEDEYEDKPTPQITEPKIGRNEPCPCGSGKKYKKCCIGKEL